MASSTPVPGSPGSATQIADLTVIHYEKLLRNDAAEAALLLSACTDWGFFYLDLGGFSGERYRKTVDDLFGVSKTYFAKPIEEKLKDTRDEEIEIFNICGRVAAPRPFKPLGSRGLDAGNVENKKNGCEHLRVPVDALFNPAADARLRCPKGVKDHWDLLCNFIRESHSLTTTILSRLSTSLDLPPKHRFETTHQSSAPSTSIAALQHYPSTDLPPDTSIGHFAHTDAGSLTVLFNSDWGLQAYSPQHSTWQSVAPRTNSAIINVGDALRFLSGHRLTSSLHRVVPWHRHHRRLDTSSAAAGPRYATIFFLRPNNDARLVDGEGVESSAGEWLERKFRNYRMPHEEQGLNAISTGRKGFTGLLEGGA